MSEEYYDIWSGANLIDTLFMMSTIILLFVFFFIRMVIPLETMELIIWLFIAETYVLGFVILRYKLRTGHDDAVRNVDFMDAGIWRDFTYYERKLLGVRHWYTIEVDWSDAMLKELFKDKYFVQLKQEIQNKEMMENYHHPLSLPEEIFGGDLKNSDGELYDDVSKKMLEQIKYKNFDLEEVTDEVKEKIKDYKIHIGVLFEPTKYKDSELYFDRICLLTSHDIKEVLETKPINGTHQGFPVKIDAVECSLSQIGYILPEIPTYYLNWSEKITKKVLEPALDMMSITYMEMKVLEKFVYTLRSFTQQAAMAIRQEQVKADMYYDAWDDILQEMEDIQITKILGTKDPNAARYEEQAQKAQQYKIVTYILIVIIGILSFVSIAMYVTFNSLVNRGIDTITGMIPMLWWKILCP